MTVSQVAKDLLEEIKIEEWVKDDTTEGEARWGNIGELLSVMHKYDQLDPEQSFVSFLEEVALVSEVDKLNEAQNDALTLMTLHLCKGLEFRHVMIAGCEEGIFPHSNALLDKEQLEEERRLMYVGMTRAKEFLKLFTARSRMLWGETQSNAPSRFLDDIPPNLVERKSNDIMSGAMWNAMARHPERLPAGQAGSESKPGSAEGRRNRIEDLEFDQDLNFAEEDVNQDMHTDLEVGSRISHTIFGDGTVTERKGDVVEVEFDSGQKKKLALSVAPLQVL